MTRDTLSKERNTRDNRPGVSSRSHSNLRGSGRSFSKKNQQPAAPAANPAASNDPSRTVQIKPQPIVNFSHRRVGVFVDVQNLYHSAKHIVHGRVNYHALLPYIVGNRQLIRAMAYATKSEAAGEDAFLDALTHAGFELRLKDLQIFPDGSKKSDWDVGLAVDAIRMAQDLDVVVLVAGDGDYVPLVEYLQLGNGKLVEVVAFRRSASMKLQEAADKFTDIEDIPSAILR